MHRSIPNLHQRCPFYSPLRIIHSSTGISHAWAAPLSHIGCTVHLTVLEVPSSGPDSPVSCQKILGPHTTIITTIMAARIIILLKAMVAGWSSAQLLSKQWWMSSLNPVGSSDGTIDVYYFSYVYSTFVIWITEN